LFELISCGGQQRVGFGLGLGLETYLVARDQRVDTAGGACCFPAGNAVAYSLCGWCVCQNELHVVERGLRGGTHDGYWLAFILVGPVAADAASFDWHDWRFLEIGEMFVRIF
jgi:hypothetical protein